MIHGGFNHNIRYKNALFHVQTEDYGLQKHVISTQMFFQGELISKADTDYQEFLDLDDVAEQVQVLMKVQHIKMLKDLVNGKLEVPEWIFKTAYEKSQVDRPAFNLDNQDPSEKIEDSIARFLEEKK